MNTKLFLLLGTSLSFIPTLTYAQNFNLCPMRRYPRLRNFGLYRNLLQRRQRRQMPLR